MATFHNWTGDEEIDKQVPQFLNADNAVTQEKLDNKFNKSLDMAEASDLNNFKDEGFYCCNSNSRAETILNCPTNYAFGLMVWGKDTIVYQEVREYNRSTNNLEYNNCWRRSYYSGEGVQGTWSKWQQMSYSATTLAGYGITDGMRKNVVNSVSTTDIMKRDVNTSYLRLTGGSAVDSGAALQLCGGAYTGEIADAGEFSLKATDSTHSVVLLGNPSGVLKWDNKNIVRSINNVAADDNGNVNIDVSGGTGGNITVDSALSSTSTNPVQNRVVQQEFTSVRAAIPTKVSELELDIPFARTDVANNFTSLLTATSVAFGACLLDREEYSMPTVTGYNIVTPLKSTLLLIANGDITLDMIHVIPAYTKRLTIFTAYILSSADHTLTIKNLDSIKYIGSASDLAITSAGLLLNIAVITDSNGDTTGIIQANKLS